MLLTDVAFLFYFFPLFLAIYYITSEKQKYLTILIGSLIFYAFQENVHLWQPLLLLGLTVLCFFVGMFRKKWLIASGIGLLSGLLLFFKVWHNGSLLPLGMSFYVFQMIAYLADIWKNRLEPERDLAAMSAQLLLFPKLLSGPLMEPDQLQAQMKRPKLSQLRFRAGLQELVLGLAYKILLADRLAGLWAQATGIGYDRITAGLAWAALLAFGLRIYFDFQGYSMMAVGIGKMLGFQLPGNFDDPYMARSVSEFFNRWHITLYRWFRNYLYIPLGGSRKGRGRMVRNVIVVWTFTGLWHGFSGNYLIWAMFLAFWILQEKLWLGQILNKIPAFAHLYTVILVLLSWVPFAIGDLQGMGDFLLGLTRTGVSMSDLYRLLHIYWPDLIAGVLFATPIPGAFFDLVRDSVWCDCGLFVLFWVCVYQITTAEQNPFLYFSF